MKKLRTSSWFLLLVILLAILVSFTMAQEPPTAAGGQVFQRDQSQLLSGEPMARSSEVTQIELSAASRHSQSLPAISVNLSPMARDDISPEPTGSFDTSVVEYTGELPNPLASKTFSPAEPEPVADSEHHLDFVGRFIGIPQPAPSPNATGDTCQQLLQNTELNVSGTSVAPWGTLIPFVYFTDDEHYISEPYSLFIEDNDFDDPSPNMDAFAQVISVPANLSSVTIQYGTKSLNSNDLDYAGGFLWPVDEDGFLIGDHPALEWQVLPSQGNWTGRIVEITGKADLQNLQGKDIAVIFFNDTTASPPNERVYFDDITFDACQPDALNSYIIVKKQTNPAGASQKFDFDPSWSASNFQLSGGQSVTSPALEAGIYSVNELPQSGWKMTGATCDDGSSPNNISLQAGETVICTFNNLQEIVESCSQMIVNSALNIVELGDDTGTAEPWSVLDPIVYYTKESAFGGKGYSLFFEDGDDGSDGYPADPSPTFDSLAQGFQMPGNLTEIRIEYQRFTVNSNLKDKVFGSLWLLDDNWFLDTSNIDNLVLAWEVGQQEATWVKEEGIWKDAASMGKMSGKKLAIILSSSTEIDASKEIFLFDEVYLQACSKVGSTSGKLFMPSVMKNFGKPTGPICRPPSENPLDQINANRGLVQTGATCSSNLSNVDIKDYYAFQPSKDGNHTLRLTKLPEGTEWAANIRVDSPPYPYARTTSDTECVTTQPGHVDKTVVCNLNKATAYVVRVDTGSTPVSGSYELKITPP